MRLFILVLLTFASFPHVTYAKSKEVQECVLRIDPITELSAEQYKFFLGKAQRLHHQIKGSWGNFLGFRQALYFENQLHVVASFKDANKVFEIVIVFDPNLDQIVMLLAPSENGIGVQAFSEKP